MFKKIGFIGQGWVGKSLADNFESRGFSVVRYSLDPPFYKNSKLISTCDVVFIAVQTPTNKSGFDDSILRNVIKKVGDNKIAVIKSTILPGTTESIQKENKNIYVIHSPEFLRAASAANDTAHPDRNIIGIPKNNKQYQKIAKQILNVLPKAPFNIICNAKEAEMIKYAGNCWLYTKIVYVNILYDIVEKLGCNWEVIRKSMAADARIGNSHLNPVHNSGRGAGGHCFLKDYAAFFIFYSKIVNDKFGTKVLKSISEKNINLLLKSKKDINLLKSIYGKKTC